MCANCKSVGMFVYPCVFFQVTIKAFLPLQFAKNYIMHTDLHYITVHLYGLLQFRQFFAILGILFIFCIFGLNEIIEV